MFPSSIYTKYLFYMYPKLQALLTLENKGFKKFFFVFFCSNSPKEPFFSYCEEYFNILMNFFTDVKGPP